MEGNLYLWALHPCGRIPWQFPKQALSSNHSTACCSRIPWPCSSPAGRKNAAATSSSRSRRRRPGFRPSRYVSFKTENCCSCISLVHAYKFTITLQLISLILCVFCFSAFFQGSCLFQKRRYKSSQQKYRKWIYLDLGFHCLN